MPNLSGLLGIYLITLHLALQGSSTSSIVIFTLGLQAFWQFSKNGFHSKNAQQNLSSSKFFLLSVFKSHLRYFMIFKNLQHGIVALNKDHPEDLSHILFRKILSPITPRAKMSPENLCSSSNATVQLLFPMAQCASTVVQF